MTAEPRLLPEAARIELGRLLLRRAREAAERERAACAPAAKPPPKPERAA